MDYSMRVHIPLCVACAAQAIFRDMALPTILTEQLCDPKVADKITCPVCTEIVNDPKCHGPCGHYLCDVCWTRCLHSGNDVCPICRCKIVADAIKWNSGMEMFMASLKIRCGFAHKGCYWKGELERYAAHARECPAKKLQELQAERDEKKLLASEVEMLRASVEDRDAELAQRRQQVDKLSSMFNSAMGEIRSNLAKINALEVRAEDREMRIETYKQQLAARGKQIAAKDGALREQLCILRAKDDKVGELCDTLRQTKMEAEDYKTRTKTGGKKRKHGESLRTRGD